MSTTMYCQPCCFRCAAIQAAFAFTWTSFTVVPYESQLFHPIGGVRASMVCASRGSTAFWPCSPVRIHMHTIPAPNHPMLVLVADQYVDFMLESPVPVEPTRATPRTRMHCSAFPG